MEVDSTDGYLWDHLGDAYAVEKGDLDRAIKAYDMGMEIQPENRHVSQIADISHPHVFCDGCRASPIRGYRRRCIECGDYDLCQNCVDNRPNLIQIIPFYRFLERDGYLNDLIRCLAILELMTPIDSTGPRMFFGITLNNIRRFRSVLYKSSTRQYPLFP